MKIMNKQKLILSVPLSPSCTASHLPASLPSTLPFICLLPAPCLLAGTSGALGSPGGVAEVVEHSGAPVAHHNTSVKGEDDFTNITDLTDVTFALADLRGREKLIVCGGMGPYRTGRNQSMKTKKKHKRKA